jgi:rubrerythrin
VDKQGARFFSFHLGELQEQEGIMGETVRKVKHGGGSRLAGRRGGEADQTQNIAELTERNMRESAAFAAQFFASHNIRRVLIGGTDDNIALFRGHLPKSWQSLIVGSFPSSMTASHAEVMERAMKIGQAAEQKREATLVENIITAAAKGQAASIGLDDTLAAIHENRVHALAITNGFRAPGYRCQSCGYLTAPKMDTCPYCGNPFEEIPDAVELAVRQVLQDGGDVDVLHENEKLKQHGNIGALLRY